MSLYETDLAALDGTPGVLAGLDGKVTLVVNVASKCGLTPQYTQLEELQVAYGDQGFSVLGVPCNQFMEQEPGTAEEIQTFCSTTYGATFPLYAKVHATGAKTAPYDLLTQAEPAGDVAWNFEKFLIGKDGTGLARYNSAVEPADPALVAAIEAALAI